MPTKRTKAPPKTSKPTSAKSPPAATKPKTAPAVAPNQSGTPTDATQCKQCGLSLIPLQEPLMVKRACADCGKTTYRADRDPKTSGVKLATGDQVPVDLARLFRGFKLIGGGQFSRVGLDWVVKLRFLPRGEVLQKPRETVAPVLEGWKTAALAVLQGSETLKGLDLDSAAGAEEAISRVKKNDTSPEFAAFLMFMGASAGLEALAAGNAEAAAGAAALAAAAKALLAFKIEFEEVVWRGHSVEILRATLDLWGNNRLNDDEEFWQQAFDARSFVLSQIFAAPLVVLSGKAYVGAKRVTDTKGGIADFLMRNELTTGVAVIELKAPTTKLLAPKAYRNDTYAPSKDLAGAVAQVSMYGTTLAENVAARVDADPPYDPAQAERIVIMGDAERQLTSSAQRRSFELYRRELRNVRVVTYDELFRRIGRMLELFGGEPSGVKVV